MIRILFLFALAGTLGACGVKGDPLPPLNAAELGRGRPPARAGADQRPAKKAPSANDEVEDDDEEN